MKLKKIISLAVCLITVITLIAGCASSKESTQPATGASASTASTATTVSDKLSPEPLKLVYLRPTWGDLKADSEPVERIRKAIKEKTNIDIELVTELNSPDFAAKINLVIASGESFDIIYDTVTNLSGALEIPRLIKEDVLIPLDDLIKANAPDFSKQLESNTWQYVKYDGKTYGLPGESPKNQYALLYRKDWLDADGLKVPATIEEWEAVAQDFKDKHNNPGFVQLWDGAMEQSFVGSFVPSAANNYIDTDGKFKPYYTDKKYKDMLAKFQEWYKKGYIHKEIATMKSDQVYALVNGGKAGLWHSWGDPSGFTAEAKKVDPKAEFIWGPSLNNGTLEGKYSFIDTIYDWNGVTKSCKHPDIAVKFLNWSACTTEGFELTQFGEEGTDYILNKRDGDKVYISDNDKLSKEKKYPGGFLNGILNAVWVDKLYTKYFLGTTSNTYTDDSNNYKIVDYSYAAGFMFNINDSKAKDKKADMDAYLIQEKYKIIMGLEPVEHWDQVMQTWLGKGGSQYIDDLTQQYNDWKAKQK